LSNVQLLPGHLRRIAASADERPISSFARKVNVTNRRSRLPTVSRFHGKTRIGRQKVAERHVGKIHFWLIGFGAAVFAANWYFDLLGWGGIGTGLAVGSIGLGIRQWFMHSAHAERQAAAFSGNYTTKDKWHYHSLDTYD
jgi:hypothetical protein